jgi:predicted aspartyl protease
VTRDAWSSGEQDPNSAVRERERRAVIAVVRRPERSMILRMNGQSKSATAPARFPRSARLRMIGTTLVVVLSLFLGCRTGDLASGSQALDDGRRWLDPRAIPAPAAPALLRAAAANARNQTAMSEGLLLQILMTEPGSESARGARELLSRIYLRSGQYRRLVTNLDEWARHFPNDEDGRKERGDMEQFRGLPDQINGPRVRATLPHGESNDFSAPLSINGLPATYLLDTGAWLSVMTETDARRFGMTIREGTGVLGDSSGKGVKIRTAVARDLVLGGMTFHDVSFAILPDTEPWRSMPPGRQGIIGIPILLSVGCIRWTKGGTWELGCTTDATAPGIANLVFYENKALLAATVFAERVFLTFDTGAETTDLNADFARRFAKQVERLGTKDTTGVTGIGGTAMIESITLPDVPFAIGGFPVVLRPAHVTMQENSAIGGRCCVGNIGLDLLLQSGEIVIDFSAMTVRLR